VEQVGDTLEDHEERVTSIEQTLITNTVVDAVQTLWTWWKTKNPEA